MKFSLVCLSIIILCLNAVSDRSRERQYVADILHTCKIHHTSLEAKSESCVTDRSVSAKVEIERILALVHSQLVHSLLKEFKAVLSLAAADNLSDSRDKAVAAATVF